MKPAKSCLDFDPSIHGIFLTIGGRGGCFLPQVARDTGWAREQLLARLCSEKLGMPADAWKQPPARLFTFTAEILGPERFVDNPLPSVG
jgi:AMMECR1 domain-containing protein